MTATTEGLVIGARPEEFLIALVWRDVIYVMGSLCVAFLLTVYTERVGINEDATIPAPAWGVVPGSSVGARLAVAIRQA